MAVGQAPRSIIWHYGWVPVARAPCTTRHGPASLSNTCRPVRRLQSEFQCAPDRSKPEPSNNRSRPQQGQLRFPRANGDADSQCWIDASLRHLRTGLSKALPWCQVARLSAESSSRSKPATSNAANCSACFPNANRTSACWIQGRSAASGWPHLAPSCAADAGPHRQRPAIQHWPTAPAPARRHGCIGHRLLIIITLTKLDAPATPPAHQYAGPRSAPPAPRPPPGVTPALPRPQQTGIRGIPRQGMLEQVHPCASARS